MVRSFVFTVASSARGIVHVGYCDSRTSVIACALAVLRGEMQLERLRYEQPDA